MANERKLNNYTVVGIHVAYDRGGMRERSILHLKAVDVRDACTQAHSREHAVNQIIAVFEGHLVALLG